jgi:hypothetical protein
MVYEPLNSERTDFNSEEREGHEVKPKWRSLSDRFGWHMAPS